MLDMVLPQDGDFVPTPSRPAPSQAPLSSAPAAPNLLLLRFALVNLVAMAWLVEGWLDLIRPVTADLPIPVTVTVSAKNARTTSRASCSPSR